MNPASAVGGGARQGVADTSASRVSVPGASAGCYDVQGLLGLAQLAEQQQKLAIGPQHAAPSHTDMRQATPACNLSHLQQAVIFPGEQHQHQQLQEHRFMQTPDSAKVMVDGRRLVKASSGDSGFGGSAVDIMALASSQTNSSDLQASPLSKSSSQALDSDAPSPSSYPAQQRPRPQRRSRTNFTQDQLRILEVSFRECEYPDIGTREQLADEFDIPEARIQVWFQNHRARARRRKRNTVTSERRESRGNSHQMPKMTTEPKPRPAERPAAPTLYERRQAHQKQHQHDVTRSPHGSERRGHGQYSHHTQNTAIPPLLHDPSAAGRTETRMESAETEDMIDVISTTGSGSFSHPMTQSAAVAIGPVRIAPKPLHSSASSLHALEATVTSQAMAPAYYPQQQLYVAVQAPHAAAAAAIGTAAAGPAAGECKARSAPAMTPIPITSYPGHHHVMQYGASPTQFTPVEWPPTPHSAPLAQGQVIMPHQVQYQMVPSPWMRVFPGQQPAAPQPEASVQQ